MAVDIGAEAIGRASFLSYNYTLITKDNPASIAGTITSIDIWPMPGDDITGLVIGTFYTTNGNTLKCRASEAIPGTITAGSKVTKVVSIAVEIGDYIGCHYTYGGIERDTVGYAGVWFYSGKKIDPEDEATYGFASGDAISLGGYIEEAGSDALIDVPLADTISGAVLVPTITTTQAIDVEINVPLADTVDGATLVSSMTLDKIFDIPVADTINGAVIAPLIGLGATLTVPLASTINIFDFFPTLVLDMKPAILVADTVDVAGLTPIFVLDKIFGVPLGTIDIKGCPTILEAILAVPLATVDVTELAALWAGELIILFIMPALSSNLAISLVLSKGLTIKSSISTGLTIEGTMVGR